MQGDAICTASQTNADEPDLLYQDAAPIFGYEESLTFVSGK